MSTLEQALARLATAAGVVETAVAAARQSTGDAASAGGQLARERDALAAEVKRLREKSEEDAALRAEAAAAVREALGDLRSLVSEGTSVNG